MNNKALYSPALAEPRLLKDESIAQKALELHENVVTLIVASSDRHSEEFRALRKGLGYTFSVVTAALPWQGFPARRELAGSEDEGLLWIAKENLRKNRLVKALPDEVAECQRLLR